MLTVAATAPAAPDISTIGFLVTTAVAAVAVAVPIWAVVRQRRRRGLDD